MKHLERLESLLKVQSEPTLAKPWTVERGIDREIARLEKFLRAGPSSHVPQALQEEAVLRFWSRRSLDSFKEARLVSYGVALPVGPQKLCVIEDEDRFSALLSGADRFLQNKPLYRHCYRGLLGGYFNYDPQAENTPQPGRDNWQSLRQYLDSRAPHLVGGVSTPQWAETLQRHSSIFSQNPCVRYGEKLLAGDRSEVDELKQVLGIGDNTWLRRQLFLAPVQAAVLKRDDEFLRLLDSVVELVRGNTVVLEQGLALLLTRLAQLKPPPVCAALRDLAGVKWGNPGLQLNASAWGRVSPQARAMVTEWLKLEFIEAFFTLLAEEKSGDGRRLEFWKRYVKSIDEMHFALGSQARESVTPDFLALRQKLAGVNTPLKDANRTNNAFIMRMGDLVIVEFSGYSNACYGYKADKRLPFRYGEPMVMPVDAKNSLKHSNRDLWLTHQDAIQGYETWEHRFEHLLSRDYGIAPGANTDGSAGTRVQPSPVSAPRGPGNALSQPRSTAPPPEAANSSPSERPAQRPATPSPAQGGSNSVAYGGPSSWGATTYSRKALGLLAERLGLRVEDRTSMNGNLWVRTNNANPEVSEVLSRWGFEYKDAAKGWWKAR